MARAMQKRRTPAAGGIFLFLGPVVGTVYGISRGEPILWMLYGFCAGVALAILVWLLDRRRN
jgi:UDP-N-acetylmuramyl pentapeptide phosphotransferase/UDP-N-acetylglucosamine-1-phosphate transferase